MDPGQCWKALESAYWTLNGPTVGPTATLENVTHSRGTNGNLQQ